MTVRKVKNFLAAFRFVCYLLCVNAEVEFLKTLVSTCRVARDPKRRGNRTEMAIPAAQWEMVFQKRLEELTPQPELKLPKLKPEPVEVGA